MAVTAMSTNKTWTVACGRSKMSFASIAIFEHVEEHDFSWFFGSWREDEFYLHSRRRFMQRWKPQTHGQDTPVEAQEDLQHHQHQSRFRPRHGHEDHTESRPASYRQVQSRHDRAATGNVRHGRLELTITCRSRFRLIFMPMPWSDSTLVLMVL